MYSFIYLLSMYVFTNPASSSLAEVRVSGVCTSVYTLRVRVEYIM